MLRLTYFKYTRSGSRRIPAGAPPANLPTASRLYLTSHIRSPPPRRNPFPHGASSPGEGTHGWPGPSPPRRDNRMIVLYTFLLALLGTTAFLIRRRAVRLERKYIQAAEAADKLQRTLPFRPGNGGRPDACLAAKQQYLLGRLV